MDEDKGGKKEGREGGRGVREERRKEGREGDRVRTWRGDEGRAHLRRKYESKVEGKGMRLKTVGR